MLFAAGLVLGADNALAWKYQIEFPKAQILLGAEDQFGLWAGDWWRVLTTGFHHGGIVHLLCNASALWFLGRLLETRLGSWRYAVFCLGGLAVSGATQSLWGPYVGLSGMLCAQFGLVWAWRRTDTWFQNYVSAEQIQWGFWGILLCVPLTWFQILPVGNACHFSGLIYGFITGVVYFGSHRTQIWKPVFLVTHAILIPWFYFLVHPVWDGTYHWRRGDVATIPAEQLRHWERAIRCDPNLVGPWYQLAKTSYLVGDLPAAWDWILRGLRQHPAYQDGINLARALWDEFPNRRARQDARRRLREIFGEDAPKWEQTLNIEELDDRPAKQATVKPLAAPGVPEAEEPVEVPIPPFTLPRRALDEIPRPAGKLPAPNPNAPRSAEEGRAA
ncbi:MAG: Rhomboid family protein [Planctomycetaceae bacterium]|nr:Rhomboid family protein [Planctomycetaceae bacterium]